MLHPANGLIKQIDEYLEHLKSTNSSEHTIKNYRRHLYVFNSVLSNKEPIQLSELQLKHILKFKKYLDNQNYSCRTKFIYLSAVRSFLKWSNNISNTLDHTLVSLPKLEVTTRAVLKSNQIDAALTSIDTNRIIGQRDKAILELMFATGIRVSELVKLNIEDIDYQNKKIAVRGKKNRQINLSTRAMNHLIDYLKLRRDQANALFVSSKGKRQDLRMTVRSVQRLVKKYASITPTILRRSFTVELLEAGETVSNMQKLLGQKHLY